MTKSISLYIIQQLKENKLFLYLSSWIYNFIFSTSLIIREKKIKVEGAFLRHVKINVHGNNSQVKICPKVMMTNSVISVVGDDCNEVIEGGSTNIKHCHIEVRGLGSEVVIKRGFTSEQVSLKACEGRKIMIGEDCMFSAGIYVSTSDFHSIVDANTGERLNLAKDVVIGDHVWLAHGVSVLKGSVIPDHVVVGKSSTVTGKLEEPSAIYVGMPAKKVKTGVTWKREI